MLTVLSGRSVQQLSQPACLPASRSVYLSVCRSLSFSFSFSFSSARLDWACGGGGAFERVVFNCRLARAKLAATNRVHCQ